MITFATFYIDSTQDAQVTIAKENILLDNRNRYFQMIETLFRSASLYHSGCKKVVLTDNKTDLSQLSERNSDIEIYRVDIDATAVMLGRLIAQLDYSKHEDIDADLVFLDSDMLINESLDSLFSERFQVALTYRTNHEMPINGGVIFVSRHEKQRSVQFLTYVLKLYQEKYASHGTWWGDQYALIDAVGLYKSSKAPAHGLPSDERFHYVNANGFDTLLVPCGVYNFSPENAFGAITSKLPGKAILHFKGYRKRLIPFYWKAYLAPGEHSLPLRTVLSIKHQTMLRLHILRELTSKHVPYLSNTASKLKRKLTSH